MAEGIYNLTDVIFCFENWCGPRLKCGHIRNQDVFEYMEKLENFVPPQNRCMQYYCYFILTMNPRKIHETMKPQRSLYIINKNPFYMKCQCGATCVGQYHGNREKYMKNCADQCFQNIESGKCKDPFVIENIGKVFFANEYKDDNQR